MFDKIFVEKDIRSSKFAQNILESFKNIEVVELDKVEDVWGRVKKPYLQKRETLNLFIGKKMGELVKETPDAYGLGNEKHFYYVHAYNCIYECQYCYLQGYFNTPDIVLFVNHKEILDEMQVKVNKYPDAWFHAGEYSDSLALSHITGELPHYWDFFEKNTEAKLEIRTKSVNIKSIFDLKPLENIYISFTLAGFKEGKEFDLKTPSVKARLRAIKKLVDKGFMIGLHFDPIVYTDTTIESYEEIIAEIASIIPNKQLGYISIGVVRFTKDVYREVENNYSDSPILLQNFTKSFDGKVRYSKPMRMWILNTVKDICLKSNISKEKIYLCMEEENY
jgi:spore photoproduct lyase